MLSLLTKAACWWLSTCVGIVTWIDIGRTVPGKPEITLQRIV